MKTSLRERALRAHRLLKKNITGEALAARMKVADGYEAHHLAHIGGRIIETEGWELTDAEWLLMKTLARVEARRIERGDGTPKCKDIDWAAGKHTGWCRHTVEKRLRHEARIGFVHYMPNGEIWLTPTGWAFVWATRLIRKPSWRVPA